MHERPRGVEQPPELGLEVQPGVAPQGRCSAPRAWGRVAGCGQAYRRTERSHTPRHEEQGEREGVEGDGGLGGLRLGTELGRTGEEG